MTFSVKEITTRGQGINDFLDLPYSIYRDDENWVAPLRSEVIRILNARKNPYFRNASLKLFVCYSEDKPVCRSVLVINKLHWEKWKKKSAFFGFFESVNDVEAVRALFGKLSEEAQKQGAVSLEGPFNPNHYSELGLLVDNFDNPPMYFETYNPEYYPSLISDAGFTVMARFHTRINPDTKTTLPIRPRVPDVDTRIPEITFRKFNIFRFRRDLEVMRSINNDAFENNWHFLPLTADEYFFSGKFMFFVTRPSLIHIAEYRGEPVGVTQFMLNVNSVLKPYRGRMGLIDTLVILFRRRKVRELIIFTVGVKKKFQKTRLATLMLLEALDSCRKYPVLSTTWMSDDNVSAGRFADSLSLVRYKNFHLYEKKLTVKDELVIKE